MVKAWKNVKYLLFITFNFWEKNNSLKVRAGVVKIKALQYQFIIQEEAYKMFYGYYKRIYKKKK